MPQFLDPKNDLVFKRVFGEHRDLLMSFLNALIPMDPGVNITKVEYLPTELSPVNPKDKNSIVDVRCTDNRGRHFIVEMQMEWSESFKKRLMFNAGKVYVKQLEKKAAYNTLNTVYTLAILNENYDHRTKEFLHHYKMIDTKNPNETIPGLEFILVELTRKFEPANISDRKMMVLWLRFLKEVGEDMDELPTEMQKNPLIREAAELCREAAYTPQERMAYEAYWDGIRTRKAIMATTHEEGMKKGIRKGRAEGRAEGIAEEKTRGDARVAEEKAKGEEKIAKTALKMVEKGISPNDISDITGLTISQIEKLISEGTLPPAKKKP